LAIKDGRRSGGEHGVTFVVVGTSANCAPCTAVGGDASAGRERRRGSRSGYSCTLRRALTWRARALRAAAACGCHRRGRCRGLPPAPPRCTPGLGETGRIGGHEHGVHQRDRRGEARILGGQVDVPDPRRWRRRGRGMPRRPVLASLHIPIPLQHQPDVRPEPVSATACRTVGRPGPQRRPPRNAPDNAGNCRSDIPSNSPASDSPPPSGSRHPETSSSCGPVATLPGSSPRSCGRATRPDNSCTYDILRGVID